MINFEDWVLLKENISFAHISEEEDWELINQAYDIAKMSGINISRVKEPTIVALNDAGEVVGAVFTSWSADHDATEQHGEPVNVWDYDVAVDPHWRGNRMIGLKLIQQAEKEKANLEAEFGEKAYTRVWVINPKLARVLQSRKYGYDLESEYKDGSAHLTKY